MRRRAPLRFCIALAAVAATAGGSLAGDALGLRLPDPGIRFGETPENPLIETLDAVRGTGLPPTKLAEVDLGAFQRLSHLNATAPIAPSGEAAQGSASPPTVVTPPSPPPDPVPTAIASALTRLIVRDDGVNPLGVGDWRTAKAAIGAFYADRGFRPVWVDAGRD